MKPTTETTDYSSPPQWFNQAIRQGLGTLLALGLDSMPALDVFEGTARLWVGDLWASRAWGGDELEQCDRIAAAFRTLRQKSSRWPQMVDFLAALPRAPEPALPSRIWTDEELAANRARLAELADEAFGRQH